jgi:cell pole-organizing protein PopZ
MSKPAGSSDQNLEEILASIRKSLAEEAADGASKAQKSPAPGGEVLRSGVGEGLSSRIAGARKATAATSGTLDGALAEFFTQISGKNTVPSTPASASGTGAEPQDPFWFLSRPNAAPAAAGKDDKPATSAAPANEEVKLSRPETLRPSLPPLFVEDREPAAPARNGVAADGAERQAAAARSSTDVTRAAQPADAPAEVPPVATPASAPETPPPSERPPAETRAAASAVVETAGAAAAAIPGAAASEQAGTAVPSEPAAAGIDSNPALEGMIAQLLEPVLVRWLDANLPRMIDAIVRAEVARVLAGRS